MHLLLNVAMIVAAVAGVYVVATHDVRKGESVSIVSPEARFTDVTPTGLEVVPASGGTVTGTYYAQTTYTGSYVPAIPTGLSLSCDAIGTTGTINWTSAADATSYYVRADDLSSPWTPARCDGTVNDTSAGDYCWPLLPKTSVPPKTFVTQTGHTYTVYVYANNAVGYNTTPAQGTLTCSALPSCTVNVSPNPLARGGNATVTWSSQNSTSFSIDNIGPVATTSGNTIVSPSTDTSYGGHVSTTINVPTYGATKRVALTSGSTWVVPSDWNNANNSVEVIGGGGDGGVGYGTGGGAGGGGAYSKSSNLTLTIGATISYGVGLGGNSGGYGGKGGDTWFGGTGFGNPLVGAEGGYGGANDPNDNAVHYGGIGGRAAAGTGQVKYSGGTGGYSGYGGAGGGGAAGPNGAGNPGGNYGGGVYSGGAGGGGGDGGQPGGSTYDYYSPASGGGGTAGAGAGAAGCGNGSSAGGGGGGWSAIYTYSGYCIYGGNGGNGLSIGGSWGPGGGGGGGGGYYGRFYTSGRGGNGGYYGGGGGGSGSINQVGGLGAQGIIVITYVPVTYTPTVYTASCPVTLAVQTPTASLTVNGGASATVNVGQALNFAWTSSNGSVFSSTYTKSVSDTCGDDLGPNTWFATTSAGTYTVPSVGACRSGNTLSFTYRVQNSAGYVVTSTVTATVNTLPSCTITATPSSIIQGQNSSLSWTSTNATGGTISPTVGAVGVSGSTSVAPTNSTTYTGTFNGPGGSHACTPATLTVTCAPIYQCSGQQITYTDSSCNTTNQNGGVPCASPSSCVPGQSSCVFPPPTFSAIGSTDGHLTANPQLVRKGSSGKLFWNVSNVASCTVSGTNGDVLPAGCASNTCSSGASGQTTTAINSTATYTLSCTALSGNSFTPETVSVLPSPEYKEE